MKKIIFGVDLGGTQIKLGKFDFDGLIDKYAIDTNISDEGSHIIPDIASFIKGNLKKDEELVGLSIGVPGPVACGVVLGAQNINWLKVDVEKEFHKFFPNIIVGVLNDANAALLGECYFGSGKGYKDLVMLTLGTGLGGGILIGGEVYEGATGSSGEVGHICLERNGRSCTCGLKGCLEQYVSATGIVRTAKEVLLNSKEESILRDKDLTSKLIFDSAKVGDKLAIEVTERVTDDLACGIASICNTINPEIVILGGGVSAAGSFLLKKVEEKFVNYAFYSLRFSTKFALAVLGNDAGIYGNYQNILGKIK